MSSKLSDLPSAGALLGADLLYVARGGVSYQTSLDDVQSAIGGEFNGVVQTYADLPVDGSAAIGEIWLVRESTGTWLINRKQRGLYQRIDDTGVRAADWQYLGEWLEEFSDANFALYNAADNTKGMMFSLTGITAGQTRTLTVPDASGTLLISTVAVTVPQGGTGRTTGTTAYGLIAAGTTATGAQQTLAAGATTEILVGGGPSALPIWTTATGSGAPVRATSPALVTPNIGAASASSVTISGLTSGRVTFATTSGLLTDSSSLTYNANGLYVTGRVNHSYGIVTAGIAAYDSTSGGLYTGYNGGVGIIRSVSNNSGAAAPLSIQIGNGTQVGLFESTGLVVTGSVASSAPSGGTAAAWKLGTVAVVSPTSPNRTIEVEVGGTTYYLHAKTTNN